MRKDQSEGGREGGREGEGHSQVARDQTYSIAMGRHPLKNVIVKLVKVDRLGKKYVNFSNNKTRILYVPIT